jgi:methyl-accepting chemotaxis protein
MIGMIPQMQQRTIALLNCSSWCVGGVLLTLGLLYNVQLLYAALVSGALSLVTLSKPVRAASNPAAGLVIGLVVIAQLSLLAFAAENAGWSIDFSPYFFLVLGLLVLFGAARPVVAAGVLTSVHFLAMAILAGQSETGRDEIAASFILHAIALALMIVIASRIACILRENLDALALAQETLARQTGEIAKAKAQAAEEIRKRERIMEEVAQLRKAEYAGVAEDFERTVRAVTHSVAATAKLLDTTTKSLDRIAQETRERASEVACSANTATTATQTVARGVAELSSSIANIAVNVSQQKEMTSRATERSSGGGRAVGSLSERSDTIGEATRAIVRIAERTNLLSLNAAIEAATAGPAGRGFTIVAQEVKALAGQAAQAATEIDELLSGVRSGTLEAERSFAAIEAAVAELDRAAIAIRRDVEIQRQSADTIEGYAQRAADDVEAMAQRSQTLVSAAQTAQLLSRDLDQATARLLENVETLEHSTHAFAAHLREA